MENFDGFGLPEGLMHTLQHMQFTTPTPIQVQAIPHALAGRDILGSAQTGTGKTGAFGIPLVARLLTNPRGSALVMAPTRELATQVLEQLQAILGKRSKIKTALLIGGDSMSKQLQQLRNRPRVLVGTPGRINDHLERGSLMLHDTNFLVLDETDRMLDLGFTVQIEKVMKFLPKARQTMLFSATLPKNIVKISDKYLNNPVRVAVSTTSAPAANITHDVVRVNDDEKHDRLLAELNARSGSVILFMKTKYSTEKMANKLSKAGHSADAIHGDLRQNKRDRVIANFRNKKYRILVATDVAARGLDIPHIEHVINYDLPQCAEDYIHRIGRTARAGAQGSAVCLLTPSDTGKWRAIHRLMDPEAAAEEDMAKPTSRGRGQRFASKPRQFKGKKGGRTERRDSQPSGKPKWSGERNERGDSGKPKWSGERNERGDSGKPRRSSERNERGDSGKPKWSGERNERGDSGKPKWSGERNERGDSGKPKWSGERNERGDSGKPDNKPWNSRKRTKPGDSSRSGKPNHSARRVSKKPARPGERPARNVA